MSYTYITAVHTPNVRVGKANIFRKQRPSNFIANCIELSKKCGFRGEALLMQTVEYLNTMDSSFHCNNIERRTVKKLNKLTKDYHTKNLNRSKWINIEEVNTTVCRIKFVYIYIHIYIYIYTYIYICKLCMVIYLKHAITTRKIFAWNICETLNIKNF